MNSKYSVTMGSGRKSRAAIIALAGAFAVMTMTGCYGGPRTTDTLIGAGLGAGTGALIGGSEGSPGTGALIGGLGGGAAGYIVGSEMEHNGYYGPRYYGGF